MVHLSTTAQRPVQPTTWHTLEIEKVLALLDSDPEQGWSSAKVKERVARFGLNELIGKPGKPWWWVKFLMQYQQPLLTH